MTPSGPWGCIGPICWRAFTFRAARAAAALAHCEEARGEAVAAGHWARRAFALAPDDEGEARQLTELLGRLGDRAGAVQTYEEFARRLRVESEVEPAPETSAAIAAVRTRQVATPSPAAVVYPPPGSGRQIEPELSVEAAPPPAAARGRRPLLLALGLLVLAAVGSLIWILRPSARVTPQAVVFPTNIAVLPFAYQGTQEFAYLGEGMVDLLSADLDGAGDIRSVDPDAVLALFRQVGRDPLEPEEAQKLAARLGAGSYVVGNVVETGGHLRLSARLHSGDRREERRLALLDGQSPQLFQLVDGLTAQLIAQQSGGPAGALPRLAARTTDSPSCGRTATPSSGPWSKRPGAESRSEAGASPAIRRLQNRTEGAARAPHPSAHPRLYLTHVRKRLTHPEECVTGHPLPLRLFTGKRESIDHER